MKTQVEILRMALEAIIRHPEEALGIAHFALLVSDGFPPELVMAGSEPVNSSYVVRISGSTKKTGSRISLIKEIRNLTGMGLKDAKELTDPLYEDDDNNVYCKLGSQQDANRLITEARRLGLEAINLPTF